MNMFISILHSNYV